MYQITGWVRGTGLTGTIFEPGEEAPKYKGAPDSSDSFYTFVCDSMYQVQTGGRIQYIGEEEINVVFEAPTIRLFDSMEEATEHAKSHITRQFSRLGQETESATFEIEEETETTTT